MFEITGKEKAIGKVIGVILIILFFIFAMVKCTEQYAEKDDCLKDVASEFCSKSNSEFYQRMTNSFRCVDIDNRSLTEYYFYTKNEIRTCKGID